MLTQFTQKIIVFLALVGCPPWIHAAEPSALEVFLRDTHSLHSAFQQKLYDEQGKLLETSAGTLDLLRPGRFRWEYHAPYRQMIIADGQRVWIYDPDLEQATLKDYDSVLENTPALLLSGGRDLDQVFEVSELEGETGGLWFKLLPRQSEAQFNRVHLQIQDGHLLKLILFDNLGQSSIVEFTPPAQPQSVAEHLFEFTPPDGVDIIDGREDKTAP